MKIVNLLMVMKSLELNFFRIYYLEISKQKNHINMLIIKLKKKLLIFK